jgi:hypothetical protein
MQIVAGALPLRRSFPISQTPHLESTLLELPRLLAKADLQIRRQRYFRPIFWR